MKIFDEGIFYSHLDIEVAKSERFGYPFCIVGILLEETSKKENVLLNSILDAHYRASDVVARIDDHIFYILLNGVKKDAAWSYLNRVIEEAVVKNGLSIKTGLAEYKKEDERDIIIKRLKRNLQ